MDSKLIVLMPTAIKKKAEEKAKSMGLSLAAYVRMTVMKDLETTGHLPTYERKVVE